MFNIDADHGGFAKGLLSNLRPKIIPGFAKSIKSNYQPNSA